METSLECIAAAIAAMPEAGRTTAMWCSLKAVAHEQSSARRMLVLMAMFERMQPSTGIVTTSMEQISLITGLRVKSIGQLIDQLERLGLVFKERQESVRRYDEMRRFTFPVLLQFKNLRSESLSRGFVSGGMVGAGSEMPARTQMRVSTSPFNDEGTMLPPKHKLN